MMATKSTPSSSFSSSSSSNSSQQQPSIPASEILYSRYSPSDEDAILPSIRSLISADLSEPYSIYVYRYFLYQWGDLCFLAKHNDSLIGVIITKLEYHRGGPALRGYIAMLAVREQYRGMGIATKLVTSAIEAMIERGAYEIALETEVTNLAAIKLYERLGFLRSKRLHRYYLSGNSAFRLMLYIKSPGLLQGAKGGVGDGCCGGHNTEETEGEDDHHHHHHGHSHDHHGDGYHGHGGEGGQEEPEHACVQQDTMYV